MLGSNYQNKIKDINDLKAQGNNLFKAKRYYQAREIYQRAYVLTEPYIFHAATDDQKNKVYELRAILAFNIGLCCFNENSWKDSIQYFTLSIQINHNYAKAYYKRSLARYELGQYETALLDISKALEFDQNNTEFNAASQKIKNKCLQIQEKKQNQRSKRNKNQKNQKEQKKIPVQKQKNNNYYKWIIGIGIVTIGLFFLTKTSNVKSSKI